MRLWSVVLLSALLAGCVGKGRYTQALSVNADLAAERDELRRELRASDERNDQLQTELDATNALLDQTNRRLADAVAEAGALEDDVTRMRSALSQAEQREAQADAALAEYRELVGRFQEMIDAGTLQVRVIDGRLTVQLATDILFPAGSAQLSAAGQQAIESVASVLSAIPDRQFQVAGHTDNVPISTQRFPSNWHLGAARAIAVVDVLTAGGLDPARVSAASFADTKPRDTNRTPEGRANNRRIAITVVPDLSAMPGYDELSELGAGDGAVESEPPTEK